MEEWENDVDFRNYDQQQQQHQQWSDDKNSQLCYHN